MAVELLARVCAEIEERLVDLRPAVAEYERLTGATDALGADSVEGGDPPKSVAPAATATGAKGVRASKRASRRSPVTRVPRTPETPVTRVPRAPETPDAPPVTRIPRAPETPPRAPDAPPRTPDTPPRAKRGRQPGKVGKDAGAAEQAIVAALEHGSHTVAELVLVSALPGTDIRAGLRPLLKSGAVTRAKRDGRAAYALSSAA